MNNLGISIANVNGIRVINLSRVIKNINKIQDRGINTINKNRIGKTDIKKVGNLSKTIIDINKMGKVDADKAKNLGISTIDANKTEDLGRADAEKNINLCTSIQIGIQAIINRIPCMLFSFFI